MMLVTCPSVTWCGVVNAWAGELAVLCWEGVGGVDRGRLDNNKAGFEPVT